MAEAVSSSASPPPAPSDSPVSTGNSGTPDAPTKAVHFEASPARSDSNSASREEERSPPNAPTLGLTDDQAPTADKPVAETASGARNGKEDSIAPVQEPVPCFYRVGRELGSGTYSVVKEAKHIDTQKWYAAKVVSKRLMRGREHLVKNEIVVLKRVSHGHPNVLTLVDYFETQNSLYLITELATGGELFDRIYSRGSFYESDAAQLMKQITSGVAHLHAYGIVHRDLKPENLLFKTTSTSANLLICDFGLSRIIDEENFRMLTTTVGTPGYMAPEIFTKKGHGKPVDIWALGVIAYLLLSGFTPFDRETPAEEREAIEKADFKFTPEDYWVHVTSDAKNFIKACLQLDPSKRPTAEEAMKLPFLTRTYRKQSDLRPALVENLRVSSENGMPSSLDGTPMNGAYSKSPEPEKRGPVFRAGWG